MKVEPPQRPFKERPSSRLLLSPGGTAALGLGRLEKALHLTTSTCSLSVCEPDQQHSSPAARPYQPPVGLPLSCLALPGQGVAGPGQGGGRGCSLLPSKHTLFSQGGRKTGSTITQGSHAIY